jgi:hypothetical protein
MTRIPGTVAAFGILTSVAITLGGLLVGGLWLLSNSVQHWVGPTGAGP